MRKHGTQWRSASDARDHAALASAHDRREKAEAERERLVDALVQERLGEKKTHRDAINSEHRQRAMLER